MLGLLPLASAKAQSLGLLRDELAGRIARAPATTVGLYYHNLTRPDSILIGANLRLHAASTMKVPVMIQIFRDADAGLLRLDDSLPVHATFPSLLDGSPFDVDRADDSDSTLYLRLGGKASVRQLLELMITRSSNLATNLLIERVGAERAQGTARSLGAWSIQVLRGVEDGKAYRAGLNNTSSAGRNSTRGFRPGCRPRLEWRTRRGGSARSYTTMPRSCTRPGAEAMCWSSSRAGSRRTASPTIWSPSCRGWCTRNGPHNAYR